MKTTNDQQSPVRVQPVVSARYGELKLCGCDNHPHRLDLSCAKIRQTNGTALTTKEIWDVMIELYLRSAR